MHFQPGAAIAAMVAVLGFLVLSRTSMRVAVAVLLAYLCVESLVLTHLPRDAVLFARFAPELGLIAVVVVRVLASIDLAVTRLRPIGAVLVTVAGAWLASAVWNLTALSTVVIGFRSELRFLPLLLLPLLSRTPRRDALFIGRVIVVLGVFEAIIAGIQLVGGPGVRAKFAPSYEIVIGGTTFAGSRVPDTASIFGTFGHYNALGMFLALSWIVLAAAGSERLGLGRWTGRAASTAMLLGVVVSGSRESAIALLVAALVIARIRFRLPVGYATALVALLVAFAWPYVSSVSGEAPTSARSSRNIGQRWHSLLSPQTWQASYYSNFRLYLLASDVELVAKEAPFLGFGIGSVSDRRRLQNGTSPLFRSPAGRRAAQFSYLYDGNWALILVEVGFLGLLALTLFLFRVGRISLQVAREHWLGLALFAVLVAVLVLGFFAPVLQLRLPGAILWLLLGVALAIHQTPAEAEAEAA
ncbi:MAG: O-antigen ligase family protein [Gaiellaceae bacterium]